MAAAQKAEEAQRLAAAFQEILDVHRAEFPPAVRPIAPTPPSPDEKEIRRRHERAELEGIGLFKRGERTEAKERARLAAAQELEAARQQLVEQEAEWQRQLDEQWDQLRGNDPDVVLTTLAEAFEDNEAPAAPVAVHGDELALVVLAPSIDIVPDRMPAQTQAGNLTLRKVSKTDRAALHTTLVLGHLLVTLREAFAVAPGITAIRAVALQNGAPDAYGHPRVECLIAGRFLRSAFDGVQWERADAGTIVEDTATELVVNLRAGRELRPIQLKDEPEIQYLISLVDVEELVT